MANRKMMQCNSLIVPTLKIEIMKTIKQIVFCVSLLLVMNCFYSCSNSNDVVINTQQKQENQCQVVYSSETYFLFLNRKKA